MTSHMVSLWWRPATKINHLIYQRNFQKIVSNNDSKDIYKFVHFVIFCLILLSEQTTIKHLMSQLHYPKDIQINSLTSAPLCCSD